MGNETFVIKVENLRKVYHIRTGFRKVRELRAVDGVSFEIKRGEVLGLAGESGCGKTTIGKLFVKLEKPTDGSVAFKGTNIENMDRFQLRAFRRSVQMIFQDPYESLNPRMNVYDIVCEPLTIQKICSGKDEKFEKVHKALKRVGLQPPGEFLYRYPHELSGGQRQRVAFARATIFNPEFIVADEPVSMLDSSIKAGILKLMLHLKEEFNVAYLFISHDLSSTRYMSKRLAIMYLGKIVEFGPTEKVLYDSKHPYVEILVASIPVGDPVNKRQRTHITSEPPSILPSGCRFHPRCAYAKGVCKQTEPKLREIENRHFVSCHLYDSC